MIKHTRLETQNTLKDVLKSRSNKGEGSKMFSYEGLEPKISNTIDYLKCLITSIGKKH